MVRSPAQHFTDIQDLVGWLALAVFSNKTGIKYEKIFVQAPQNPIPERREKDNPEGNGWFLIAVFQHFVSHVRPFMANVAIEQEKDVLNRIHVFSNVPAVKQKRTPMLRRNARNKQAGVMSIKED